MIKYKIKQLIAEKEFELQRHISIGEVVEGSGVSRTTLSRMINRYGFRVGTDVVDKLCTYFGCEVGELLEHVPPEN